MNLWIPDGWDGSLTGVVGFGLVFARVLGLCLTGPGIASPGFSLRFRLGLALMLGMVLAPLLSREVVEPSGWTGLVWAALGELLSGSILGMMAGLIVAGARAGGDLVAAQAGLSTATLFDPELGGEITAIGRLYGWVATIAFLMLGGPLALVVALAESYAIVPAGQNPISDRTVAEAFGAVARALELALRAAAPAALALILAGIAMAWLSRTAPSLPFLILALPIRTALGVLLILVGLVALALMLSDAWSVALGLG